MDSVILVAFITGLTAGGLSCFAVQGGLLSGSIAQRIETAVQARGGSAAPAKTKKSGRKAAAKKAPQPAYNARMLQPILLFMLAKLAAYTVLGFLLGWLGSVFSFSPAVKGFIQLAIGVFLVGNALRMFNVHPIFRYFSFEPPSGLRRYIRRVSKGGDGWVTPLFLGALTVLIPCGVTQSMIAVAVGTGSPWLGATILFAFVLGTSPTFVGISWLATHLGGLFQKYFYQVVAVIVLLLGVYTLDGGLVLTGSPVSLAKIRRAFLGEQPAAVAPAGQESGTPEDSLPMIGARDDTPGQSSSPEQAGAPTQAEKPAPSGSYVAQLDVENGGYAPDWLVLPANQPVELHLVTDRTRSCSRAFYIPDLEVMEILPESGDTVVNLPAQPAGTMMDFMCSMGMYTGVFEFK
jgi:sulfite exporter TauE/SafE